MDVGASDISESRIIFNLLLTSPELKKRFKSSFKEFVAALLVPKDIFLDFSIGLCVAFEIII